MKKLLITIFFLISYNTAMAHDQFGRVIEVIPQVYVESVPVHSCSRYPQPIQYYHAPSPLGGAIGAIVGGAVGSTIGGGSGKIAAIIGGGAIGAYIGQGITHNRIHGITPPNPYHCGISHYERHERVINYKTIIEYNGILYVDYFTVPYQIGAKINMGYR